MRLVLGAMNSQSGLDRRDLQLLAGIARGPGHYPTPSPDRVQRLLRLGVIKRAQGGLTLSLKGRLFAWLWRLRLIDREA